jgi:hypothetical protein
VRNFITCAIRKYGSYRTLLAFLSKFQKRYYNFSFYQKKKMLVNIATKKEEEEKERRQELLLYF